VSKKSKRIIPRGDYGPPMYQVSDKTMRRINAALVEHDRIASQYERRWGIDRLPDLVPAELRAKYEMQCERLNAAIATWDADSVEKLVPVSCRAYAALETAAIAEGETPLRGDYYEAALNDGRPLIITRDVHEQARVAKERPDAIVWGTDEVARVVGEWEAALSVMKAKTVFPGASVARVKEKADLNDDIPF